MSTGTIDLARRYVRDLVYGANDGLITTFAIAAGVTGAQLDAAIVLILGAANLIADGFSMGASNYLSLRSDTGGDAITMPKSDALRHGSATFAAFVVVGCIPLVAYVLPVVDAADRFWLACGLTFVALFGVGAARTLVATRRWWQGGLEMLGVGALAASVAYLIGWVLGRVAQVTL